MEALACPKCLALNPAESHVCQSCGHRFQRRTFAEALADWWALDTGRRKLVAVAVIVAIPFVFGPLGLVTSVISAFSNGDAYHVFAGPVMAVFTSWMFPLGLVGDGKWLAGVTSMIADLGLTVGIAGWLIYAVSALSLFTIRKTAIVRGIFLALVLLVIWNTAGCYMTVAEIH